MELEPAVRNFSATKVVVVGDVMLDVYVEGRADRVCREAPVPRLSVAAQRVAPGGAANVAMNLRAMGASVELVTVVGDDAAARRLHAVLDRAGVGLRHVVVDADRRTLAVHRIVSDGHLVLRIDEGDRHALGTATEQALAAAIADALGTADALALSDYAAGVVGPAARAAVREHRPRTVVVDAKHLRPYRDLRATAVTPSWDELPASIVGTPAPSASRADLVERLGPALLAWFGSVIATITLDREGAVVLEEGAAPHRCTTRARPHGHAIGAGDTYVAALTLGLAGGLDGRAAAELASTAADIAIERGETACCQQRDLLARLRPSSKAAPDIGTLLARVARDRAVGHRIVLVTGTFEVLHRGHLATLRAARQLGDVLVVAVASDDVVRRVRGAGRPVAAEHDRVQVLCGVADVDHVVVHDHLDALIEALRPDVFARGDDADPADAAASGDTGDRAGGRTDGDDVTGDPSVGAARRVGAEVRLLPHVPGRSTDALLRRMAAPGAITA